MANILWNPAANNPCLKEPTTGPFAEVKAIFILLSYFFLMFILILSSIVALGFVGGVYVFSHKILIRISPPLSMRATWPAHLALLIFTILLISGED